MQDDFIGGNGIFYQKKLSVLVVELSRGVSSPLGKVKIIATSSLPDDAISEGKHIINI